MANPHYHCTLCYCLDWGGVGHIAACTAELLVIGMFPNAVCNNVRQPFSARRPPHHLDGSITWHRPNPPVTPLPRPPAAAPASQEARRQQGAGTGAAAAAGEQQHDSVEPPPAQQAQALAPNAERPRGDGDGAVCPPRRSSSSPLKLARACIKEDVGAARRRAGPEEEEEGELVGGGGVAEAAEASVAAGCNSAGRDVDGGAARSGSGSGSRSDGGDRHMVDGGGDDGGADAGIIAGDGSVEGKGRGRACAPHSSKGKGLLPPAAAKAGGGGPTARARRAAAAAAADGSGWSAMVFCTRKVLAAGRPGPFSAHTHAHTRAHTHTHTRIRAHTVPVRLPPPANLYPTATSCTSPVRPACLFAVAPCDFLCGDFLAARPLSALGLPQWAVLPVPLHRLGGLGLPPQ